MAKAQLRQYVFNATLGQIEVPGKIDLQQLLVITDTTKNVILYNFADPTFVGTTVTFSRANDLNYITALDNTDGTTTIQLNAATITSIGANGISASDVLQILYEQPFQYVRSPEVGTDAFERQRVAAPQSLLDADFEYGMQPTKWLTISQQRAYPAIYEIPGTDLLVTAATSDASIASGGLASAESLITITTQAAHGYAAGQPFTIKGFNSAYQGFDRAEGSFVVYTASTYTFTYYAKGKVGYNNNDNLYTPFIQLRQGGFYTGSQINAVIPATALATASGTNYITLNTTTGMQQGGAITFSPVNTNAIATGQANSAGTTTGTSTASTLVGSTLTVGGTVTGAFAIGQVLSGTGVPANTIILSGGPTAWTVSTNTATISVAQAINSSNSNYVTVSSTQGMYSNMPLYFSGTSFGGLTTGSTYYVQTIVDSRTVTLVTTSSGNTQPTLTAAIGGNMYIVGGNSTGFGGITPGVQYYISQVVNSTQITVSTNITYPTTITATNVSNNYVTFGTTTNMTVGEAVVTGGSGAFGGLSNSTTYYVFQIIDSRNAILTTSPNNILPLTLSSTATGSLSVNVGVPITLTTVSSGFLACTAVNQPTITYSTPAVATTITASAANTTYQGSTVGLLTVTAVTAGTATQLAVGMSITGTGFPSGTVIIANASGTGSVASPASTWYLSTATGTIGSQTNTTYNTSAIVTVNTISNHGFVAGDSINTVLLTADSGTNNNNLAAGPFFVETVPSATTFTYTARAVGLISGTINAQIYARPDSFYSHRPFDGGVQLGTGLPAHGSQAIRMSKKYIRYQSGKAINFNTGLLMAPNYFVRSVAANTTQFLSGVVISNISSGGVVTVSSAISVTQGSIVTITASNVGTSGFTSGIYFVTGTTSSSTTFTIASSYINTGANPQYTTITPIAIAGGAVTATCTIAPAITVTTDDVDHGCQIGATVQLSGVLTSGYNTLSSTGQQVVAVIDERTVVLAGQGTLGQASGVTGATVIDPALLSLSNWTGATVRSGTFDEQNGVFYAFDGQQVYAGRRSSTFQLAGTVSVLVGSGQIIGINTRFTSQLWAGDRIVIRGMTHLVTQVVSDTLMYVNPQYRGYASLSGIKITKTIDRLIPQSQWNLDRMDGSNSPYNPSGYLLVPNRMQMVAVQWTWYGAGFIDWMLRGPEGKYVTVHRLRNNNLNNEAWMRSGNLPVRYEVQNESARTFTIGTVSVGITDTTIPVQDTTYFPVPAQFFTQAVQIDNEIITYTGKINTNAIASTTAGLTVTTSGTGTSGAIVFQPAQTVTLGGISQTIGGTTNMVVGQPIVFTNAFATQLGNIVPGVTYYVAGIGTFSGTISGSTFTTAPAITISASNTLTPLFTNTVATSVGIAGYLAVNALTGCTRNASITPWAAGSQRTFTGGAAAVHLTSTGVILINGSASPIVSHWGAAFIEDGGFDSDRSYIFNYSQPNVNITTKKTTAFAIRLAPSVSNALPGDLGARELINRASFLLQTLESSAGSGAGNAALVIEGVINPSNMPSISNIQFASMNSSANPTGQPSFSQVAPGNSMVFQGSVNNFLNVPVYVPSGTYYVPLTTNPAAVSPTINIGDDVFFPTNTSSLYGQTKVQNLLNYSSANGNAPSVTATVGVTTIASMVIASTSGAVTYTSNGAVTNGQVVVITGAAGTGSINTLTTLSTTIGTSNVFYLNGATSTGATLYSINGASVGAAASTTSTGATTFAVNVFPGAYATCTISGTTLSVVSSGQGTITAGMLVIGAGIATGTYVIGQLSAFSAGTLSTWSISISQTISSNTPMMFVAQTLTVSAVGNTNPLLPGALMSGGTLPASTWAAYQLTNTSTNVGGTGTYALVNGSGTVIPVNTVGSTYSSTYYGLYLNQVLYGSVAGTSQLTAQINLSRSTYALPGETVFSYINAPANKDSLDLSLFKELTNTPIGGRGCYPNGCDIMFVNAYITQGSPINQNLVLRWGEAQA